MFRLFFIIGSGSFADGISRFLPSRFIQNQAASTFPFGTFVVNIPGCFLIGLFYGFSGRGKLPDSEWRMLLTVGFCGGFTTFSTFANENILLLREGEIFHFALYASLSVFLGLMATYLGNLINKIL